MQKILLLPAHTTLTIAEREKIEKIHSSFQSLHYEDPEGFNPCTISIGMNEVKSGKNKGKKYLSVWKSRKEYIYTLSPATFPITPLQSDYIMHVASVLAYCVIKHLYNRTGQKIFWVLMNQRSAQERRQAVDDGIAQAFSDSALEFINKNLDLALTEAGKEFLSKDYSNINISLDFEDLVMSAVIVIINLYNKGFYGCYEDFYSSISVKLVCRSVSTEIRRERKRIEFEGSIEDLNADPADEKVEKDLDLIEKKECLDQVLARLGGIYPKLFELYMQGLSEKDLASFFGIDQSRVSRRLKRLKEEIAMATKN